MEDYDKEQAKVRVRRISDATNVTIIEPRVGPPTFKEFLREWVESPNTRIYPPKETP